MSLIERIKTIFNEHIQTSVNSADLLSEKIAQAGQLMVQCLLNNNKMLCCGNGAGALVAQLFAANMLNRYQTERPSLPAFSLTSNTATITSLANENSFHAVYSKQIKALGQSGDILLVISSQLQNKNIVDSIEAAHQRNLLIIALTGGNGSTISHALNENDLEINVSSTIPARIQETHLLIIHCLCDIIDRQLFDTAD